MFFIFSFNDIKKNLFQKYRFFIFFLSKILHVYFLYPYIFIIKNIRKTYRMFFICFCIFLNSIFLKYKKKVNIMWKSLYFFKEKINSDIIKIKIKNHYFRIFLFFLKIQSFNWIRPISYFIQFLKYKVINELCIYFLFKIKIFIRKYVIKLKKKK